MNTEWLSMDVGEALGRYFSESGRLVAPISHHHSAVSMIRDVAHYAELCSSIAQFLLRYRRFALLSAPVLIGGVAVAAVYLSQRTDDNCSAATRASPLALPRTPVE